jgi:acyl carrier protein
VLNQPGLQGTAHDSDSHKEVAVKLLPGFKVVKSSLNCGSSQDAEGWSGMAAEDDILKEIILAIRSVVSTPEDIGLETNIRRDLNMDSLATMDFVMALETRFNVVIPLDQIAEVQTVGDLVHILSPGGSTLAA